MMRQGNRSLTMAVVEIALILLLVPHGEVKSADSAKAGMAAAPQPGTQITYANWQQYKDLRLPLLPVSRKLDRERFKNITAGPAGPCRLRGTEREQEPSIFAYWWTEPTAASRVSSRWPTGSGGRSALA
jgi:hypothetical protein